MSLWFRGQQQGVGWRSWTLLGPCGSVSIHGALRVGLPYSLSPSMAQAGGGSQGAPTAGWEVVGPPFLPGWARGRLSWGSLLWVTRVSGRELVQGTGALLYYLPDGTRVIQEPSEQVWPEARLSPVVSPGCPCSPGGPQLGARS